MQAPKILVLTCLGSLLGSPANAQEAQPEKVEKAGRKLLLSTGFGLATPLGLLGAEVEWQPLLPLSVAIGVGTNFFSVQLSTSACYRHELACHGGSEDCLLVGAGAGVSRGPYQYKPDFIDYFLSEVTDKHWSVAYWANGEIFIEGTMGRFMARGTLGLGTLVNASDGECRGQDAFECEAEYADIRPTVPYGGFSLGYYLL